MASAAYNGFATCPACGLLARLAPAGPSSPCACPRCTTPLHTRKPDSLQRCWALLSAACVLLVPANLLPVMQTRTLLKVQSDTIVSGVAYLWNTGSWPLALIVFIASVLVPVAKLASLGFLLVSVKQGMTRWRRERTQLYRLIEFIGRWSMLDIFVVTLLAALVRLQALATVEVGPGALAFGAVVVLTLFATHAFDPRLIWDTPAQR
jgi:paraquat-inducible protein A